MTIHLRVILVRSIHNILHRNTEIQFVSAVPYCMPAFTKIGCSWICSPCKTDYYLLHLSTHITVMSLRSASPDINVMRVHLEVVSSTAAFWVLFRCWLDEKVLSKTAKIQSKRSSDRRESGATTYYPDSLKLLFECCLVWTNFWNLSILFSSADLSSCNLIIASLLPQATILMYYSVSVFSPNATE